MPAVPPPPKAPPPRLLISFSPEDDDLKERLVRHLQVLVRFVGIELWSADRIRAGADWRQEIDKALEQADVALLLISADFLASDFLQDVEMPKLFQRREQGGLKIVPVLLRSCHWEAVPWLDRRVILPRDGNAVASFEGNALDKVLAAVAKEVVGEVGTEATTHHEFSGSSVAGRGGGGAALGSRSSRGGTVDQGGFAGGDGDGGRGPWEIASAHDHVRQPLNGELWDVWEQLADLGELEVPNWHSIQGWIDHVGPLVEEHYGELYGEFAELANEFNEGNEVIRLLSKYRLDNFVETLIFGQMAANSVPAHQVRERYRLQIEYDIDCASKRHVIQQLSASAATMLGWPAKGFTDALLRREERKSTAMGMRSAIPHCYRLGLVTFGLVLGILPTPVEWGGGVDQEPVDTVLLIVAPKRASVRIIGFMVNLGTLLRDDALMGELRRRADPDLLHLLVSRTLQS